MNIFLITDLEVAVKTNADATKKRAVIGQDHVISTRVVIDQGKNKFLKILL